MARTFDITEFLGEHKSTEAKVKKGEAKVCTKHDCPCGNVPLDLDAFYRDKSQAGGRSPWCKAAERTYNAAYYVALKKVDRQRKRDIDAAKDAAKFERTMKPVRHPKSKKRVRHSA
jgi:hypothetical protein